MTRLHPLTALVLAFQAAVLVLLVERPTNLLAMALLAAAFALTGGAARWWRWLLLLGLAGTWSLALSQGMFYADTPRTVLVQLVPPLPFLGTLGGGPMEGISIYREGLWHGAVQSLRIHTMILLAAGLLARYGADRLAQGLRAGGLPAALSFLVAMALRHVPVLAEEARTLWIGQRLRGMRLLALRGGALTAPGSLLLPLLAANLRRADEIAAALHARGFSLDVLASAPRERPPRAERILAWCGAAGVAGIALAVALTRMGGSRALPVPWLRDALAWVAAHV